MRRRRAWFPTRRDPAGFTALAKIGAATDNFTFADQAPAFQHLTRILIHNGGTLAEITVEDCLESYRAQVGYSGQQRTHWYRLLGQARAARIRGATVDHRHDPRRAAHRRRTRRRLPG